MRRSVVPDRIAALSIAILLALVALTTSGVIATMASGTETRSLTSTADTQIVENAPTKNYGAVSSLGVNENDQSSIGKDKFALVKWDLSEIAPGTQINSALVTLNVATTSPQSYQAYVLKEPWVESAATWNVYSSGMPWEVAGAKGALDKEATVAGTITPSVKGKNTLTLPLAVVQGWVDDPATNQGIIIANPSSTRGFNFSSREVTDPTRRPKLTLDLSPDTTPPETTIASGPSGTISSGDTSFTFSSEEAGSTFQCQLDPLESAPASCTSPKAYSGLMAGTEYTFSVWATDAAGNTDPAPATSTFTPLETGTNNVKDFGATGNGTSDDTAAFERAMAQAGAGEVVYVPAGAVCIQNNSNQTQEAPSSRRTCLYFAASTTTPTNGVYNHPTDGTFENVHSKQSPYGWGLVQITGGENLSFYNISSDGGVPLRLENYSNGWTPMKNITADGVTCKNGHDAVHFNPHGATHLGNIQVTNVVADSCESAISIAGDGTYGPNTSVDGVTVIPSSTAQIRDPANTIYVGAWLIGDSKYCIDGRATGYTVALSNLDCGGLPNLIDRVF